MMASGQIIAQRPHPVHFPPFMYSAGKKLFSFIFFEILMDPFGQASMQRPQLLHMATLIRIIPFNKFSIPPKGFGHFLVVDHTEL